MNRVPLLLVSSLVATGACAADLAESDHAPGEAPRPALGMATFTPPQPVFDAVATQKLNRLLSVTEDSDPSKPDVHMRLGRLHAAHARELRAAGDPAGAERALAEALAAHEAAAAPAGYPRADENLHEVVALLCWGRREAPAREALARFAARHPGSRFLPAAYLRVGELLYDQQQFEAAANTYAKVAELPHAKLSLLAQYRRAWAEWAAGQKDRARIDLFECSRAVTPPGEDPAIDSRVRTECGKDHDRLLRH
jgi:tetratricopeptide (TPR) repeat protein